MPGSACSSSALALLRSSGPFLTALPSLLAGASLVGAGLGWAHAAGVPTRAVANARNTSRATSRFMMPSLQRRVMSPASSLHRDGTNRLERDADSADDVDG